MKKIFFVTLALLTWGLTSQANPRSKQEMKRAAAEVLARPAADGTRNAAPLALLKEGNGYAVYGYQNGGFAVVAADDNFPAVLGFSESAFNPNTDNPNFKWWLQAMEKVVGTHRTAPLKIIKPDPDKHAASVAPLVKTKWGQDDPYSMYVPEGCPTGCVATAASQVLKYNEWPDKGVGEPFTFYPFGDFDGTCLKENISNSTYNYKAMLNEYGWGGGDGRQRRAVGLLMYNVGLAMKAQYSSGVGTGAYNESLCYGLRNHLKYPLAVTIDRSRYTDEEWMDIIFTQLTLGRPLVYGGSDQSYTGHEFVLHGYNSQGKIYINWGWDGQEDGYFDLAALNVYWGMYDFNYYQDVVLRCNTDELECDTFSVQVTQPGTLAECLTEWQRDSVVALKVEGPLNGTDLRLLREMAGSDAEGHGTMGHLSVLDLSGARFVEGGDAYRLEADSAFYTYNDEMPAMAFADCSFLIDVTLPDNLKHYGDGVFANCNNLDTVKVTAGEESDFCVEGRYVLSADKTELIEALPGQDVHFRVPEGITCIHDFAFAGRYLYERLSLPTTLQKVGAFAFNRCFDLARTYLFCEEPPVIETSAIDKLDLSLRALYVPKGTKSKYKTTEGWKLYGNSIYEFDAEAGIQDVRTPVNTTQGIFSIDGMKMAEPLQQLPAGTYIVNGKKYLKK